MKRDGFPQIFQKESTLYGNSYYSFAQESVQKIREMDTKVVDSQQVSVSAPNPPKTCL
jgi:hypothetical protein